MKGLATQNNNTLVKRPDSPQLRDAIFALEKFIEEEVPGSGLHCNGLEWVHRFAPGIYVREMIVPAGLTLTGAIHKTKHISIFLEGKMIVPDENGKSRTIEAPMIDSTMPGVKRVGMTIERVRWLTIHATDLTDIDELEDMLVTNDFSEVEHLVDQQDYASLGIPDAFLDDLRDVPVHDADIQGLDIRESKRHGMGLFSSGLISKGAVIAPAVVDGKLMIHSRYCNHAQSPNAICKHDGNGSCDIVALRDINNEEITVDYRINMGLLT